jgi:L-ribulose-5-phosphate 4-epimerase
MTTLHKIREKVWQANLYLWQNRLVYGTQGNVSGIDRGKGRICIKPSGVAYEHLKKEMITEVDLKGVPVGKGHLKPSVDTPHHVFLYKNLKEAGGVCHTHSRFITVFAVLNMSVPVLTTCHADAFGREIPVSRYVDNIGDNIGEEILRVYQKTGCSAIILGRHGLFSIGETPERSAFYALMAEYCAEVSYYAIMAGESIGRRVQPMADEEIPKWYNRYHSSRYGQSRSQ